MFHLSRVFIWVMKKVNILINNAGEVTYQKERKIKFSINIKWDFKTFLLLLTQRSTEASVWLLSLGTLGTAVGQPPNEYAAILSVCSHEG